jgi:hypothetical protein
VILPSESAPGRLVIYKGGSDDPPTTGVITRVSPRRVFVRLGSRPYSMAVDPAELDFIARRRGDRGPRPHGGQSAPASRDR